MQKFMLHHHVACEHVAAAPEAVQFSCCLRRAAGTPFTAMQTHNMLCRA